MCVTREKKLNSFSPMNSNKFNLVLVPLYPSHTPMYVTPIKGGLRQTTGKIPIKKHYFCPSSTPSKNQGNCHSQKRGGKAFLTVSDLSFLFAVFSRPSPRQSLQLHIYQSKPNQTAQSIHPYNIITAHNISYSSKQLSLPVHQPPNHLSLEQPWSKRNSSRSESSPSAPSPLRSGLPSVSPSTTKRDRRRRPSERLPIPPASSSTKLPELRHYRQ